MAEFIEKCAVCEALLDEEDLFCANCGTEAPHGGASGGPLKALKSTYNFDCEGCGASMSYDASAKALRCPFCGSEKLTAQKDTRTLSPRRVVPLTIERQQAEAILRQSLTRGFMRPADLSRTAVIESITPVYVPYWVFSARTFTYWTADTNQTPPGARANWYPLSGEHRSVYDGLLVGASSVLTPAETEAIAPFDLANAVPPEQIDLNHATFEQFRVQRKYARPLAQQGFENLERQACAQYVPGQARNLQVNVRTEGLTSEPVLLPVWVMAYRYKDRVFRFLINGQTGKSTGQIPSDWKKVLYILLIILAVGAMIVLSLAACGGLLTLGGRGMRADAGALRAPDHGLVYSAANSQHLFTPRLRLNLEREQLPPHDVWPVSRSSETTCLKTKAIGRYARSGCGTWSANGMSTSVCRSPSMRLANAATPWGISCSMARPA